MWKEDHISTVFLVIRLVFQSTLPKWRPKLQVLTQQTDSSTALLQKQCEQTDLSARQAVLLGSAVLPLEQHRRHVLRFD